MAVVRCTTILSVRAREWNAFKAIPVGATPPLVQWRSSRACRRLQPDVGTSGAAWQVSGRRLVEVRAHAQPRRGIVFRAGNVSASCQRAMRHLDRGQIISLVVDHASAASIATSCPRLRRNLLSPRLFSGQSWSNRWRRWKRHGCSSRVELRARLSVELRPSPLCN